MSNEPLERALGCLDHPSLGEAARARLQSSVRKAWGPAGSLTPPRLAASIARGLELADPDGLVAVVGLFYTAVDLSDDVSDGDAEPVAQGDPERLLLLLPELARELDLRRGSAMCRALSRGGLAMWDGQDADLAARDRFLSAEEVWAIAEAKAGEELAAVFAAIAEAAGEPSGPWIELGRAFGTALQVYSDLLDFGSGARDWDARQPTWPLAVALNHPTWGPALRDAWAGDHQTDPRRERGAALVAAAHDAAAVDALAVRIATLGESLPAARDAVRQVLDALHRWRTAPDLAGVPEEDPGPAEAHQQALASSAAFLLRDPELRETIEHHQHPLWGHSSVSAPLFGRLLAAWAAREAGLELDAAWARLLDEPPGGYRYFPTVPEVALDTDLAGWLLTAGVGDADLLLEALEAAVPRDLPTWLGPAVGPDGHPLTEHPCVASMASASRGLHTAGSPHAAEAWDRTLRARKLVGPRSPYYRPLAVDALLLDAAVHCGVDASRLVAPLTTLGGAARLSGLLGDLWITALATPALLDLNRHPSCDSTRRALVDGLRADGGAPATGAWRTIPRSGREGWYRSRQLCTSFVLRALRALVSPALPLAPSSEAPTGPIGTL